VERELFVARLREAAARAHDFARTMIVESLPDALRFRVRLNSSHDGNPPVGDERRFPEDSSFERAVELHSVDEERAISTLWRGGRIPEWIDVSVIGETVSATLVELRCCGRFTAEDRLLYHEQEGRPPFHVLGPALPPDYDLGERERFSIYHHSECWTLDELDHLRSRAGHVWSLELVGDAFDDATLASLPALSAMELLNLVHSAIDGSGLATLARFPRLRRLSISCDQRDAFRLDDLAAVGLESVTLDKLPPRGFGLARLLARSPKLCWLELGADNDLVCDGACPAAIEMLTVRAKRVHGQLQLPARMDSLRLSVAEMTDRAISAWLAPVRELHSLGLSGTRLTNELAETLPRRYQLRSLDITDTQVTAECVARIAEAHPKLRLRANPRAAARPANAIDAVIAQFARTPLVALSEMHGNEQGAAFLEALVRDRRFAAAVQTIVVEFGNALHQDLCDRYVAGEDVPDVRKIWCDFAGAGPAGFRAPIYPRFFEVVREVNRSLATPIRVLLGDPPVDWSAIHAPSDPASREDRDEHFARVVEREVLDRGGRALIVAGGFHLVRAAPFADITAPNLVQRLDRRAPVYVIAAHFGVHPGYEAELEERLAMWPCPGIADVHGTWLGSLDANVLFGRNELTRVYPDGTEVKRAPYADLGLALEQLVDAYLWLGPLAAYTRSIPIIPDEDRPEIERRAKLW